MEGCPGQRTQRGLHASTTTGPAYAVGMEREAHTSDDPTEGETTSASGDTQRRAPFGRRRSDRPPRFDLARALTIALGVGGGILLLEITQGIVARLQGLLVALLVSLFLSFAMEPAVQWLARRGMRRGFATGLVFIGAIVMFAGFFAAMSQVVITQVENLVSAGPQLLNDLADQAQRLPGGLGDSLSEYLQGAATEGGGGSTSPVVERLSGGILAFSQGLLGAIVQMLTILLVTFYLVADGPRLRRTIVSRVRPDRQSDVMGMWELAIDKTGGYVYGRLLLAITSAVFHAIAFQAIGLSYGIALGIWVGVISSLIPVVGTYLAGALPLAVALASDPIDALWVLLAVIVYQQVENYVLMPRITAHTMALHPAVAFMAVLAGAALLGAVGALLALPVAAIISALAEASGEQHEIVARHDLLEERRRSTPTATSP